MSTAAAKAIDKLPGGVWLALGAAVGVLVVVGAARKHAAKLNPANPDNLVYSGVNAVGDKLDDGQDNNSFSLGAWIYDVLHPYDNFELSPQWQGVINQKQGIAE